MDKSLKTKKILAAILLAIAVVIVSILIMSRTEEESKEAGENNGVANFEECVAAGNPAMESYPRQCRHKDQLFTEDTEDIDQVVGDDRDNHGCIGSAGYSWCAPKGKCLRLWEEACYSDLAQEFQYRLAEKYKQPVDEVHVAIVNQAVDHVSGNVRFGSDDQAAGGMFLAVRIDNLWHLVYDGNGSVDCASLRQEYMFPDDILKPNFCD